MTKMIDEKRLKELTGHLANDCDLCDEAIETLAAALRVVRAAKKMDACCVSPCGIHRPELQEALQPFSEEK